VLTRTFPLRKTASTAEVSPIVWAWLVAFCAGGSTLLVRRMSRRFIATDAVHLRCYLISALVSVVLPHLLIFSVIPSWGSGFIGVLLTLSPVFTLLLLSGRLGAGCHLRKAAQPPAGAG